MNILEPIWQPMFIHNSYACIKGKGVHKASKKAAEYTRQNEYCYKFDISKFYPSVNHDILLTIIEKKIKCKPTLRLLETIIRSNNSNKNVPIGNYTSQWFGNLYMNELDTFIKHTLKAKHYVRYNDDFLIFDQCKKKLNNHGVNVLKFVIEKLDMKLSKQSLFKINQGVDFVGFRHFRNFILLRKSTIKRVKRRLKQVDFKNIKKLESSLASTIGWLSWANSTNFLIKNNILTLNQTIKDIIYARNSCSSKY